MFQVKGYSISRLDEDVASQLEPSLRLLYERVWDEADYVVPPAENGAFFVTTNVVITPNQTRGLCPEVQDRYQHCYYPWTIIRAMEYSRNKAHSPHF